MFFKKKECIGEIEHRGRHLSVNCRNCTGPRSLSERVCFLGLSGRITPGFTGEVILRAGSDSRYRGSIVEALTSCSEIGDMISSIGKKGAGRKARSLSERVMAQFVSDPRSLAEMEPSELSAQVDPDERERVKDQLESLIERTRRMLIKLEGSSR